jgi:hypothetical protein
MLKPDQCALLRTVKAKPFEGKQSLGHRVPKRNQSEADAHIVWARFKAECVLLKKGGVR